MKKNIKNLLRAVALVGCIFTGTQMASAQCASIKNDGACPVTVDVDVYSGNCTLCNSFTNVVIGAGTTYNINCSGCTACDISVTVTDVAGSGATSPPCDFTSGAQPITGAPAGCLTGATVSWNSLLTGCKIQ